MEDRLSQARRVSGVGEAGFSSEHVAVQPVEQLLGPARDDLDLGKVDVGIDEARHNEMRTMIDHGQSRIGELRIVPDSDDDPVLDEDRPVLDVKVIGTPAASSS
jgi:hypothetical protein